MVTDPELADALDRFGADGPAPFYTGDIAAAVVDGCARRAGPRLPPTWPPTRCCAATRSRTAYRDASVYTNPPPSAGGILVGRALAELDRSPGPPDVAALVAAMAAAEQERSPEFLDELTDAADPTAAVRGTGPREPARLHHARLGARRRRLGLRSDLLER